VAGIDGRNVPLTRFVTMHVLPTWLSPTSTTFMREYLVSWKKWTIVAEVPVRCLGRVLTAVSHRTEVDIICVIIEYVERESRMG
jgi:hypothetical protein